MEEEDEKEEGDAADKLQVKEKEVELTEAEQLKQIDEMEYAKKFKGKWTKVDFFSLLEQYDDYDRNTWLNQKFIATSDFRGPVTGQRQRTNKVYVIALVVLILVFFSFAGLTLLDGRPSRLMSGMDFRQEICGRDSLKSKP